MQINDFTGGINNKQSTFLIAANEAIDLDNVDFDNSTLKAVTNNKNLGKVVDNFYFTYKNKEFQSDIYRTYITKTNYVYWTDGVNKPKKYSLDNDKEYNLGIDKPLVKPMVTIVDNDIGEVNGPDSPSVSLSVTVVNLTPVDDFTLALIDGDFASDNYEYLVVNYYGLTNSYALKKTIQVNDEDGVRISNVTNIQGEKARVYRFFDGVYRLVGEVTSDSDTIDDIILDISSNEEFIDNVEFGNNVEYKHKAIYKDSSNNYGYKIVSTITEGTGRVAGFELSSSSDDSNDTFVGHYRLYGRRYLKTIDSDKDTTYDLTGQEVEPSISQLSGSYKYAYSYYNSDDGTESKASDFSIERNLSNKGILITNIIKSEDPQVDKIRLYRLGGTLTRWHLIEELDNVTQEYTDTYNDAVVLDDVMDNANNTPPVEGLKQLTYVQGYYVGFKDDKIYWNQLGNPNYWSDFNYIKFEDTITGIGVVPLGILVFLKNKTYIIQGTDPSVFVKFIISSTQGCVDYKTINYVNEKIIWLSNDGFCTSTGGEVLLISQSKLRKFETTNIVNSVVVDMIYYLAFDSYILTLDFRYNGFKIFKYSLNIKSLSYDSYEDKFYGVDTNNNLVEMFKGDSYSSFTYKSPYFSLSSISNVKLFNEIYIAFEGDITIDIVIDEDTVNTKSLSSSKFVQKTALATQVSQRGNYLQLIIKGTGKVHEIEFKAIGRQNGK